MIVYLALFGPDSEKEERGYMQMAFSSEEQGFLQSMVTLNR